MDRGGPETARLGGPLRVSAETLGAPRDARVASWLDGGVRWTPSFGQVFVTAKVESGFMIHAAFGWPEVGRNPRLRSASSLVYASSGVRPLSDEWGRHRL